MLTNHYSSFLVNFWRINHRHTMLQLMSHTKWYLIQISIIHDNIISSQVVDKKKSLVMTKWMNSSIVHDILVHLIHRGGGVHSIVKLNTTCGQKKYTFGKLHHQNDQNFINFFSWVDIHGIYYIVKNSNHNLGSMFLIKHTVYNYNDA